MPSPSHNQSPPHPSPIPNPPLPPTVQPPNLNPIPKPPISIPPSLNLTPQQTASSPLTRTASHTPNPAPQQTPPINKIRPPDPHSQHDVPTPPSSPNTILTQLSPLQRHDPATKARIVQTVGPRRSKEVALREDGFCDEGLVCEVGELWLLLRIMMG